MPARILTEVGSEMELSASSSPIFAEQLGLLQNSSRGLFLFVGRVAVAHPWLAPLWVTQRRGNYSLLMDLQKQYIACVRWFLRGSYNSI